MSSHPRSYLGSLKHARCFMSKRGMMMLLVFLLVPLMIVASLVVCSPVHVMNELPIAPHTSSPPPQCERTTFANALRAAPVKAGQALMEVDFTNTVLFDVVERWLNGRSELASFQDDERVICGMAFLYLNNCEEHNDTLLACGRKMGPSNLQELMPKLCRNMGFFAWFLASMKTLDSRCGVPPNRASLTSLSVGVVDETQMVKGEVLGAELREALSRDPSIFTRSLNGEVLSTEEDAMIHRAFYIPPHRRPPHPTPQPYRATSGTRSYSTHPFGFAIISRPRSMMYKTKRLFDFFPLLPSHFGAGRSSIPQSRLVHLISGMNDEWLYATLLQYSMFAFTHKRGGWDCLRNAEIMFYGAVPVFPDVLRAPTHALGSIPREELTRVMMEEPLLSGIGYLPPSKSPGTKSDKSLVLGDYMEWCTTQCIINFRKLGSINMKPYLHEHEEDVKAGRASGPIRRTSPAIVRAYEKFARPLWDLYGSHYSAASMMTYVLRTIGFEEPKRVLVVGFSNFRNDYIHESVCAGLSDLGIAADSLVQYEAEKFARLDGSVMEGWSEGARSHAIDSGHINDPRILGMERLEKQRTARWVGWKGAFTTRGRWNPFVLHRIGHPRRPDSHQKRESHTSIQTAKTRLLAHAYDVVIYSVLQGGCKGIPCAGLPLADVALEELPQGRVVFFDHNDQHGKLHESLARIFSQYGPVFQREYSP